MQETWQRGGAAQPMSARILEAERLLIAAAPGAIPPHLDAGGHLPFGGTLNGGTSGKSAFGKRKIVTSDDTGYRTPLLLMKTHRSKLLRCPASLASEMCTTLPAPHGG